MPYKLTDKDYEWARFAARKFTTSASDAEDSFQEMILKTLQTETFNGDNANGWFQTLARNMTINNYRRAQQYQTYVSEPKQDRYEFNDTLPFDAGVIAKISALPVERRMIVLFINYFGFTQRETSTAMCCPIGTVLSMHYRAIKQLQKEPKPQQTPAKPAPAPTWTPERKAKMMATRAANRLKRRERLKLG